MLGNYKHAWELFQGEGSIEHLGGGGGVSCIGGQLGGLYMQLQGIEFMPEQEGVQEEGYVENNKNLQ